MPWINTIHVRIRVSIKEGIKEREEGSLKKNKKKEADIRVQIRDGHTSIKEPSFPLTNANPSAIDGGTGGFIGNR